MADLIGTVELQPKDILQFVEKREGRALEVLREIIDVPEYDGLLNQAIAVQSVPNFGSGGLGVVSTTPSTRFGFANQQVGGLNGGQ